MSIKIKFDQIKLQLLITVIALVLSIVDLFILKQAPATSSSTRPVSHATLQSIAQKNLESINHQTS